MNIADNNNRLIRRWEHWVGKAWEFIGGTIFLSRPIQAFWQSWSARNSHRNRKAPVNLNTALYAHIFYPELIGEIVACYHSLPGGSDLHITTTAEHHLEVVRQLAAVPSHTIHLVPNRGRDIAPFLWLLQNGVLDQYDVVLKLHTKKSSHLVTGQLRRRLLYTLLAGSRSQVNKILAIFNCTMVGIVGWKLSFRREPIFWLSNRDRVTSVLRSLDPNLCVEVAFFEGAMFWFRPIALSPLKRLNLTYEQFEPEAGQLDGMLHHAVERCFVLVAASNNYTTRSLNNRQLYP